MKRILLVTTSYPDQNEGKAAAGVFVRDFAGALVREGVEVEVIAPAGSDSRSLEDGVDVLRFGVNRLPLSLLKPLRPDHWSAIARTLVSGARAVMESCEKKPPDHILSLWALPSGVWARRAGRRYGIPYSTWALGSDIWDLGKIPIVRRLLKGVLTDATLRFADGFELAGDVERLSGRACGFLPSSRIIPRPSNRISRRSGPYRLAFLGRWHMNKGIDLLIDALKLLGPNDWSRIEEVRIHGGGPMESVVRAETKELASIGRPVSAGGYLGHSQAVELMAWADYLIIPSRIESIPVVFSDAMQSHCPVIATPVGDLPRLVSTPKSGILADRVSSVALSEAIQRALTTKPSLFGDGMRHWAREFDIALAARNFLTEITPLGSPDFLPRKSGQ